MEAPVDQCSIDKNVFEIQIKQLRIDNDKLLNQIMSQEIVHIVSNSVDNLHVKKSFVNNCNKCLELETELLKKKDFIEKEAYDKHVKSYSNLEKHCISLELATQLNQEIFQRENSGENLNAPTFNQLFEINELKAQSQEKDTVIRKLKERIKCLSEKEGVENVKKDIDEIETINIKLEHSVNNRDAHEVYIEKTIEYTDTLSGFVESARTQNPCEPLLESARMFTKHDQELLVYVSHICPSSLKHSGKLVAVTPMNKDKKVRFTEPVTSSSNIPKHTDSLKPKDSNKPLLTSTGVKLTTSASGSMPSGNTKNNRITITPKKIVHLKETTSKSVETPKPEIKVYSRRPKPIKLVGSSKKAKIVESKIANNSEPTHLWGSNATYVPSSSSLVNDRLSRSSYGTVRFGNDQVAKIMRYSDYQQGNIIISRVYYVERLRHNLFSVGQFCDADLEVVFRKNTYFILNLEGFDLHSGSRDTNLYIISLDDMLKTSPICLLSKASKTRSWLSHHRLSHLNFGTLNKLAKDGLAREKLYLLHMDLCGPMRVESINGKKYILVIVNDYSRFTWVKFLRSKDEAPDAIIKSIKKIQVSLNATVRNVRTDNETEFVNQTLHDFYENVGISHQTSVACTPQQNGVVERRNQTLMEAARTMLIFSKAPLEDLGKLNAKADIGLGLQVITPTTSCSGLVPNIIPQQPCNPPNRDDWDSLFQPLFDEYFNPPTIVVSPDPVAAAPRAVSIADSPVSTSIDQDVPSTSILSKQEQEHSLIISQGVKELPKTPLFHDDTLYEFLHEDSTSKGSSSNVRLSHTPFELIGRWTKDHPIENVIGDPSRSVSTRKQLKIDAMWCYFDALLTFVEPKNFEQAMTEPS
ncbi:retrovirus-related pol polyprotein from transposon TNT 1-94 [Tanacetum coccineum]|uniref:Retrovirus-related pol polyprotein from transposon TNT 1-94 n=1 Tax=Tanacetum coccineum TaxID=301880 RepID=A0ABQ5D1S9_9ASTR